MERFLPEYMQNIINNAPYAVAIVDTSMCYLAISEKWKETLAVREENLTGKSHYALFPLMGKQWPAIYQDALNGKNRKGEERVVSLNGSIQHLRWEVQSWSATGNEISGLVMYLENLEEKIRLNEEQFRGAFEYSATGMTLFDLNGKWIKVNQSFCNMLGYTREELMQLRFQEITHPGDINLNVNMLENLISANRDGYQLEKRYIHKSGKIIWVLLNVSLLRDAEGNPVYCISQTQDITEKKIAEKLVRDERKLLRTLIDNLPINVYIKDLHSRKTMVNTSEINYMDGLTEAEIIGKNDFDLFPVESAMISFKEDRQVLDTGKAIINKETTDKKADGCIKYLLTSKIPLRNSGDEIIGLLGISYDITQIKEAEHALALSEEKYRKIFENTQDIYYSTDENGIVIEISPSVEQYYNYKREHIIGNPVTDFYYYKEDREKIVEALLANHAVTDFEVKLRSNTSELLYASVNSRLLIEEDGTITGSEGSIRDITLRKVQENELTLLNKELTALNKHKEKLLSIVGHDLRNPIASALKLAELALMDIEDTTKEELTDYLVKMHSGLSNANELLEELLQWAKSQFDSLIFHPVQINDLKTRVEICLRGVRPMAETKEIRLIDKIEEGISLAADKDMLDAIIRNLVSNAIKFTGTGGTVTVLAVRRTKDLLFSVTDTGTGIPKKIVRRLFDKSFSHTTYGTSGEKGTGLGLDLCRDFVEKHGGKIWVQSVEGQGSSFHFTIPLVLPEITRKSKK